LNPDTFVNGNVQIVKCVTVELNFARISGDLALLGNSGTVEVTQSTIGGNLQVNESDNPPPGSAGTLVTNNNVGGNLQCIGNTPPVLLVVTGNNVTGTSQCQQF
jgi:hypothetical protein